MPFTKVGPFVNGGPPFLEAATLNSLETNVNAAVTNLDNEVAALQQPATVAPALVGTAAARAGLTVGSLTETTEFYETDTTRTYRVVGGAWLLWASPWLPVSGAAGTYPSGLASPGFGYPPVYRLTGGDVALSGVVQKSSGVAWAGGDVVLTLPSGLIPTSGQPQYLLTDAGGSAFLAIQSNPSAGQVTVHSTKGTAPTWLSLDGFTIRRT